MKLYTLRQASVICPKCETVFATPQIARMPKISTESRVEADLHRVLPDASLRAALIATCPECIYTWWLSAFASSFVIPEMAPDAPPVAHDKKFAHAVLSGRNDQAHPLDRAIVALNGYWCCREQFDLGSKFLELAAKELTEALEDESWYGNRGRYQFIMGELLRLMGNFHGAVRFFEMVTRRSDLPRELVVHQINKAREGSDRPVLLPPHIIESVFKLKKVVLPQKSAPAPAAMPIAQAHVIA